MFNREMPTPEAAREHSASDALRAEEKTLKETARATCADWRKTFPQRAVTPWMRRLLIVANLFAVETAIAEEIDEELPPSRTMETEPTLPPMSESTWQTLTQCFSAEEDSMTARIILHNKS